MSDRHSHEHAAAFGADRFGRVAERIARFLGTPRYIIGQTVIVIVWIALNVIAVSLAWDPYPFILLNLAFSTQAAYAAPLILLAQTRQADRDKVLADAAAAHREEQQTQTVSLLQAIARVLDQNTALTEQDKRLTEEIHALIRRSRDPTHDTGATTDDEW